MSMKFTYVKIFFGLILISFLALMQMNCLDYLSSLISSFGSDNFASFSSIDIGVNFLIYLFSGVGIIASSKLVWKEITNKYIHNAANNFDIDFDSAVKASSFDSLENYYTNELSRFQIAVVNNVAGTLCGMAMVLTVYFFLLYKSPFYTIMLSILVGCIFLVLFLFLKPIQINLGQQIKEESLKTSLFVNFVFKEAAQILFLDSFIKFKGKWKNQFYLWMKSIENSAFWSQQGKIIFEISIIFFITIMALFFIRGTTNSAVESDQIILLGLGGLKVLPAINALSNSIQRVFANYDVFLKIFFQTKNNNSSFALDIDDLQSSIKEYKDVLYKDILIKNETSEIIIHSKQLTITKGKNYFISGKSGSGKSTLMRYLLGMIKNPNGSFMIKNNSFESELILQKNIIEKTTYLKQDAQIFPGTIEQNINFPDVDSTQLDDSLLQKISLLDRKQKNNDFKEVQINNSSRFYSGGEIQRARIGHLFNNHFDNIFLDECFSQVDEDTEKRILKEVLSYHRNATIFYISHRPNLKEYFDKLITLKDKNIEVTDLI